ncbi:hypothetical protein COV15_00360 [Candidatus Woesearchaeota archaeon CG10_big_fil_rev_8_21_14_0_10_34_12]|nr:MAG: hypothetical protein COV15_00360 [Candidatus Woesearchaeota archaeon CG10_big_fil_rev_8_21_14_0_10_34_12]
MNKKGQFYILAAVIIIGIILGLGVAVNTAKINSKPEKFYDMSGEFGKEAYKVIDYSIANQEDIDNKIENFTETYIPYLKQSEPDTDITFIFGDYNEVQVVKYSDIKGKIKIVSSVNEDEREDAIGIDTSMPISEKETVKPVDKKVKINVAGTDYDFDLNDGENFLFVLKKCKEDECYVAKS